VSKKYVADLTRTSASILEKMEQHFRGEIDTSSLTASARAGIELAKRARGRRRSSRG